VRIFAYFFLQTHDKRMSMILYYSKTNSASSELLTLLNKAGLIRPNLIHVLCVDIREKDPTTGKTYLIHGKSRILCPNLQMIPALMMLSDKKIIYQKQNIEAFLSPLFQQETAKATNYAQEPEAFMLGGSSGVSSDSYTFLDSQPEELEVVNGNASMRQLKHYASLQDTNQPPQFASYPQQQEQYQPPGGVGRQPTTYPTPYQPLPPSQPQPPSQQASNQYSPFISQQPPNHHQSTQQIPTLPSEKIERNADQNKAELEKRMEMLRNQREQDSNFFKQQFPQTY